MLRHISVILLIILVFPIQNSALEFDSTRKRTANESIDKNRQHYSMGEQYYNLAAYRLALENYIKSLYGFESINDFDGISDASKAIADIYLRDKKNYPKAIEFYIKALNASEKIKDSSKIAGLYNNLGICYGSLSEYKKAYKYFIRAYNLKLKLKDTAATKSTIINLGELSYKQADYELAYNYFSNAIQLCENDSWALAYAYINIAKYYIEKKDFKPAFKYLNVATDVSLKNSYYSLLKLCYLSYINIYSLKNDIDKLNKYNELYLSLKDSVYNDMSLAILSEMQTKYESMEKEHENAELRKEKLKSEQKLMDQDKTIVTLIIVVTTILLISIIIYYLFRKQKHSNIKLVKKNRDIIENKEELLNTKKELEKIIAEIRSRPEQQNDKYTSSNLSDKDKDQIYELVTSFMTAQKPYLDPNFSLQDLTKNIKMSRTYVSQVINEKSGSNFNSFVNNFRVNEAKQKLSDPVNRNITIEAIANDVGFKSKSAFYSAFKKFSGVTPTHFLKSLNS